MFELVLRLVFSLAVVLGLMLLVARVAQRRLGSRAGAPLSVLHRQAVGRHASVAVVAVGGRTLLLGVTEQQVQMLAELDGEELARATALANLSQVAPVAELTAREQPIEQSVERSAEVDEPAGQPFFAAVLQEQTRAQAAAPAGARAARPVRQGGARRAVRPARAAADTGPLAGSLLSPTTWRRAAEAVRGRAS